MTELLWQFKTIQLLAATSHPTSVPPNLNTSFQHASPRESYSLWQISFPARLARKRPSKPFAEHQTKGRDVGMTSERNGPSPTATATQRFLHPGADALNLLKELKPLKIQTLNAISTY